MTLNQQMAESSRIAEVQDEKLRAIEEQKLRQRKLKEQASRQELFKNMLESRREKQLQKLNFEREKADESAKIQKHQQYLAQTFRQERIKKLDNERAYNEDLRDQMKEKAKNNFKQETQLNDKERKYIMGGLQNGGASASMILSSTDFLL